jgi:hypothetical protein
MRLFCLFGSSFFLAVFILAKKQGKNKDESWQGKGTPHVQLQSIFCSSHHRTESGVIDRSLHGVKEGSDI